ncbi:unnamed protein product [Prorocentrum cordatum]|uniref:Autophagy-related protein 9 n=1 Tax=Prorocentrum cordatum TaxID=2364126 RepID=A0ABN9W5B0_9DINO|nr:unnamed protein product [Polarella glacialis]
MESDAKVELVFQWLQGLIVENINVGVLTIPAPILTRSFQDLGDGKESFEDALKVSIVQFPFPYAQTCDCMLLMHWLAVPFVVTQWMSTWWLAFFFAFGQVFTLYTLNLIAEELENPFGSYANDLDSVQMQSAMNQHLRMLINSSTQRLPLLQPGLDPDELTMKLDSGEGGTSFHDMWAEISYTRGVRVKHRCASVNHNAAQPGSALRTWASSQSWASRLSSRLWPSEACSSLPVGCVSASCVSSRSKSTLSVKSRSDPELVGGAAQHCASDSLALPQPFAEPSLQSWPSRSETFLESPRSPVPDGPMPVSPRPPDKPPPVARKVVPRLPLDALPQPLAEL